MEVKVEKLKQSKVKLIITVEPEEMIKHFNHAFNHIAPTVKLPGFRPGKAPRKLVESTVGISRILSEGIDLAINEGYVSALKDKNLNPLFPPSVKINKYPNYGETKEEIGNPLEFEVEVTVFPEVELGDYSKVKVDLPAKEKVKEDDVKKILENLQKQKATFVEIDRPAKMGDWAEISFEGSIKKVKIDQMTSKNHPVVLGEGSLIPGFEDQIVGMKKGEKKTFNIKFPKDYHAKEHAGKEAEFAVELLNLKEVNLPVIDDAFASDFGQKDADTLKKEIEKNLEMELEKKYENDIEVRVLDKVLPLVKADIPDEMADKEVERMLAGYQDQLKSMGLNFDAYLNSVKKTVDDLKKDMRPTAEKNIKIGLMLGKIMEQEKLDPNDPDAGKKAIEHLIKVTTTK
jgi:trigger factor